MKVNKKSTVMGIAAAVILGFTLLITGFPVYAENSSDSSTDIMEAFQSTFRRIAQENLPVVVQIDIVNVVKQQVITDPFQFFFNFQNKDKNKNEERTFKTHGLGSGIIVKRTGDKVYVLTNNHVTGDAEEIGVTLSDGREFAAKLVGKDPRKDIALIMFKTDDKDIHTAVLGDSDTLQVGDLAFAVGNPLGFESTITSGIISAIGRHTPSSSGVSSFTDYIQTDAAINRGNSGGALVNLKGEVIGINTWIASTSGGNEGLGFAIPINKAKNAIDEFIKHGKVEYGWLGINTGDLPDKTEKALNIGRQTGAFVYDIFKGSPADKSGLKPGDFITRINNINIKDSFELVELVGGLKPDIISNFEIIRYGKKITLKVKTSIRKDEGEIQKSRTEKIWPGLSVVEITDDIRDSLDLPSGKGNVVVGKVVQGSPAASAGLRTGDIVLKVNNGKVKTIIDFYKGINDSRKDEILLRIYREGHEIITGIVR